jgi:hypothetical protein
VSELETPAAPVDAPAPDPVAAEPEPQAVAAPVASDEPITDDAALNADIEAKAIKIPDGEELVPRSLLTNVAISYRNKLKEAKQGSPEALALKQQLDTVQAQLNEAAPLAEAFRAIRSAQPPQQQQQVQQPPAEDTSELMEIAKDFDFYTPDGKPDIDRARRVQARESRRAHAIAQQQTAPLVMHTLSGQAQQNIQLAKATKHPVTGKPADPAIIDRLVAQLQQQDGGLATLANRETMKHVWLNAYSLSTLSPDFAKEAAAPVVAAPPTPALVTERSGGAIKQQPSGLSASEKKAAKEAGLTEKAYLDVAAGMKW